MNRALIPLTLIYRALSGLHKKITMPVKLPAKVISVGNITWGGTGKTPVVIALAKEFVKNGAKTAVLTRGYARKSTDKAPVIVSDGKNLNATAYAAGDEARLIAEKAAGAIVISGPDRAESADIAAKAYKPDIYLLDDGFQNWKIERDIDIVCVNAANPFGNGQLIPSGILREDISSLSRADHVIITNSDTVTTAELVSLADKIEGFTGKKTLKVKYTASALSPIGGGEIKPVSSFKGKSVVALSAIAENANFAKMLGDCGISVVKHSAFKDHHWFTEEEIIAALSTGIDVITTEKDAVRIKPLLAALPAGAESRIYSLAVQPEFIEGENDWESFARRIKQSL